jgi:hypothetical protein
MAHHPAEAAVCVESDSRGEPDDTQSITVVGNCKPVCRRETKCCFAPPAED